MRALRRLACGMALAWAVSACGTDPEATVFATPVRSRANAILEPPTVKIGDVAILEIAVVTPPGHVVRPFAAPKDTEGFWVLDSEILPVHKEPQRWVHRTQLRLRARAVGRFEWPAATVEVEVPDGGVDALTTDALTSPSRRCFPTTHTD